MARWQSGHAADCKSVNAGSIPTRASMTFCSVYFKRRFNRDNIAVGTNTYFKKLTLSPGGGIGRHTRLKILRLNGRAGSIPAPGTIIFF